MHLLNVGIKFPIECPCLCALHATTPKTRKDKIESDHVIKLFEI